MVRFSSLLFLWVYLVRRNYGCSPETANKTAIMTSTGASGPGPEIIRVGRGDSVIIQCYTALPDKRHNVVARSWYFDPVSKPHDRQLIPTPTMDPYQINLYNIDETREGYYSCCLRFKDDTRESNSLYLSIVDPIELEPKVLDLQLSPSDWVKIGERVVLNCQIRSEFPGDIYWWQKNNDRTILGEYASLNNPLVLPNVSRHHAGDYTCIAERYYKRATKTVTLRVQEPLVLQPHTSSKYLRPGEDLSLSCPTSQSAGKGLKFKWFCKILSHWIPPSVTKDVLIPSTGVHHRDPFTVTCRVTDEIGQVATADFHITPQVWSKVTLRLSTTADCHGVSNNHAYKTELFNFFSRHSSDVCDSCVFPEGLSQLSCLTGNKKDVLFQTDFLHGWQFDETALNASLSKLREAITKRFVKEVISIGSTCLTNLSPTGLSPMISALQSCEARQNIHTIAFVWIFTAYMILS